jgi:hypothetical protein
VDGLQEYLDDNPQLKEYVKDGVILWDKLGVDIDEERKQPDYDDDLTLFMIMTVFL